MTYSINSQIETSKVRNAHGRDNWVVVGVDQLEGLDNLKARLKKNNWALAQFTLQSQPTGRQRKPKSQVCWLSLNSGEFFSIL